MKRLFIWLLWAVALAALCVGFDQLLLHAKVESSLFTTAQTFYQDFRGRLIKISKKEEYRLDAVKENWPPKTPSIPDNISTMPGKVLEKINPILSTVKEAEGYVYVDKAGELHIVSNLEEVPKDYRPGAKALQK